jgi:HPt (histidine-containing phosphotransfer) domain-containing protein
MTDSWDATFREIRARFVARTGEWVEEIAGAADALERDPGDAATLRHLATLFHRIAGSAGTYGLPRVSEFADEGEFSCHTLVTAGGRPASEDIALWRRLAEAIGEEINSTAHIRDASERLDSER